MSQLSKVKYESESRLSQEQQTKDRKRNVIVLIERYLLNLGFIDSCTKLQQESSISLSNYDAADNMDLYMIICEFEQFQDMKFGRLPKLVKKVDENKKGGAHSLPKIAQSQSSGSNSTVSSEKSGQVQSQQKNVVSANIKDQSPGGKNLPPKQNKQKGSSKSGDEQSLNKDGGIEGMEIQGNSAFAHQNKKEEEATQDFFDVRVLKGLPNYEDVPEYEALAHYLQRDILIENPNVRFNDIVGLENAKRLLKEAVSIPLKYPHFFTGILEPWRGVLLYGPPGTGKTMLAKAVATECKTTFFNISASSVVSKWRGESEKLIRVLFDLARFYQPSTIFLDEIDSIMGQRKGGDNEHEGSRRMKTELLIQLDGLMKNKERVFLLAASNLPWDLDVALLRRVEKRILVPLPNLEAREDMLRKHLPPERSDNLDYKQVAAQLEKYSGSDVKLLCKEAAMKPLRRLINQIEEQPQMYNNQPKKGSNQPTINIQEIMPGPVTMEDVQSAQETTKPSSFLKTELYQKWEMDHGSH